MRDLQRNRLNWTQTERFSAVIILAAMIAVIVPAAIEYTHQAATTTIVQHQLLTLAR
jgi:Ca2+/H+ antiporter